MTWFQWSLLGLATGSIGLCAAIVFSSARQAPRVLSELPRDPPEELIHACRKEALERSSHFETLLVALGSFELGILAYIGGLVAEHKSTIENPQLVFALAIFLFLAVTVAYLHTWKIYMSYGAYIVRIEIHSRPRGFRITSEVFDSARRPLIDANLRWIASASNSLQVVSVFPVFVLTAAVLGFARPLGVTYLTAVPLAVILLAWSFIYSLPASIEFIKLVDFAQRIEDEG